MHFRVTLLLAILFVGTIGCTHQNPDGGQPVAFARAAAQFKANAGRDRRVLGDEIQRLMPHCPITQREDTGTGTLVAYDYAHPSYRLTKSELFQSLGQPDGSNSDSVWYMLAQDTNNMIWEISIDFRNDYVVGSTISGSLKSDK